MKTREIKIRKQWKINPVERVLKSKKNYQRHDKHKKDLKNSVIYQIVNFMNS